MASDTSPDCRLSNLPADSDNESDLELESGELRAKSSTESLEHTSKEERSILSRLDRNITLFAALLFVVSQSDLTSSYAHNLRAIISNFPSQMSGMQRSLVWVSISTYNTMAWK